MRTTGGVVFGVALALGFAIGSSGCGIFAMQKDQDQLALRSDALEKRSAADLAAMRTELDATRERLDNALRANADNGTDLVTEKARINQLAGRLDEAAHAVEELRSTVTSMRTELDARIDDLKRTQAAAQVAQQTPPPPPVAIPAEKGPHFAAFEAAWKQKDWGLARTLGHEYLNRYPVDEKADDVVYLMGDADMQDGRPSSALGEFNRLLKQFPKSNVLDKTLFGMGEAYFAMHDCTNAKLAFEACATHFPREKLGVDAKARMIEIDKAPPGVCAPP